MSNNDDGVCLINYSHTIPSWHRRLWEWLTLWEYRAQRHARKYIVTEEIVVYNLYSPFLDPEEPDESDDESHPPHLVETEEEWTPDEENDE